MAFIKMSCPHGVIFEGQATVNEAVDGIRELCRICSGDVDTMVQRDGGHTAGIVSNGEGLG